MKSVKENLVEINSQICNSSEESEFNTAPQVIVVTKYVTIDRA
ncbi:YggS family pyridoxal phosphate enzyme, partial [Salmonella sp. 3DZ2-4SM]